MTLLDYLDRLAEHDEEARAFLDKSNRQTLAKRFWADLAHAFHAEGRERDYHFEAREWHLKFVRAMAKLQRVKEDGTTDAQNSGGAP